MGRGGGGGLELTGGQEGGGGLKLTGGQEGGVLHGAVGWCNRVVQ